MFTTYLFTGLMIISATIAVILSVHNKHWLSGCFSAFTFGLAASIVIPIWNEPYTTGYVMVGMFFLYHGIMELKESLKPQVSTYKEKKMFLRGCYLPRTPMAHIRLLTSGQLGQCYPKERRSTKIQVFAGLPDTSVRMFL